MKRRYFPLVILAVLALALCLTACTSDNGKQVPGTDAPVSGDDPVPVWQFCHGVRDGLDTAVITLYTTDCETGLIPAELSPEDEAWIRNIAVNGVVTGKASDTAVTGGTWVYSFEAPGGEHLLSIEMYRGLIVSSRGMYSFQ